MESCSPHPNNPHAAVAAAAAESCRNYLLFLLQALTKPFVSESLDWPWKNTSNNVIICVQRTKGNRVRLIRLFILSVCVVLEINCAFVAVGLHTAQMAVVHMWQSQLWIQIPQPDFHAVKTTGEPQEDSQTLSTSGQFAYTPVKAQ